MLPRSPARARPQSPAWIGLVLLLAAAGVLDALACRSTRRIDSVPRDASQSLSLARLHLREERRDDLNRSLVAHFAEEARDAAPDWVAPRRFLDDLAREGLTGAEALEARLDQLDDRPADAGLLYLTGRLEGTAGVHRFHKAREIDPDLAWAWHGQAWESVGRGDLRGALRHGRRALERARDSWERSFFAQAQARYLLQLDRAPDAVELLSDVLRETDLFPLDRIELQVSLAQAELACEDELEVLELGLRRALDLIAKKHLTEAELRGLLAPLTAASSKATDPEVLVAIEAALGARPGSPRDQLRVPFLLQRGADELALALWRRSTDDPSSLETPSVRAARLAAGEVRAAIDDWVQALPAQTADGEGFPLDPRLRRIVELARGDGATPELGEALMDAGMFLEARGLASALAAVDAEAALELDVAAARGRALLGEVASVLNRIDLGYAIPLAAQGTPGEPQRGRKKQTHGPLKTLDALLQALEPAFERHLGDGLGFAQTPRLDYGPIAVLAHPGPTFSAEDERFGRGTAGQPVPGLAAALDSIGRFGIFGRAIGGGGPDGTILRRLATEWREGEHLGVSFRGTVVWCAGTDVPSRPARNGARITGAALHEGYWVDVEGIRGEHRQWRELSRRFSDEEEIETILAGRGPRVRVEGGLLPLERAKPYAELGEAERIRLAVLRDRRRNGADPKDPVPFQELVALTALHEEGHLCDRTRFLPITSKPWRALSLVAQSGFSPNGVARMLEYRAQLVAICEAEDPRVPLADCVAATNGGGSGTPHASAYRLLVTDWLEVLEQEEELQAGLDPERYWMQQLHLMSPENVRRVSLLLAERRGMVE